MSSGLELSERDWLIGVGRDRAESSVGARFLWPDSEGGTGIPCSVSALTNSARLRAEGGGVALFDDAIITVRTAYFPTRRPQERQLCRLKVGPNESWRRMKIESVTVPPGAATLQLNLNSADEGA